MKLHRLFYSFLLFVFITSLFSCGVSKNTGTGNFIQKRKYTKGFYFHLKGNSKTTSEEIQEEKTNAFENLENEKVVLDVIDTPDPKIKDKQTEIAKIKNIEAKTEEKLVSVKRNSKNKTGTNRAKNSTEPHQEFSIAKPTIEQEKAETIDYGKLYKNEIKKNYRLSWGFTVVALLAAVGTLTIYGWPMLFLGALTLTMYVLMFVFLVKTGQNIEYYLAMGGVRDSAISTYNFFVKAHIVVGSLFSLIFFLIPMLISLRRIKKATRHNY